MGDRSMNGGVDKEDFMELMRELGLWGRKQKIPDINILEMEMNGFKQ